MQKHSTSKHFSQVHEEFLINQTFLTKKTQELGTSVQNASISKVGISKLDYVFLPT